MKPIVDIVRLGHHMVIDALLPIRLGEEIVAALKAAGVEVTEDMPDKSPPLVEVGE